MDITDLTARLLVLFLPGIICVLIVDALTIHQERQPFQFVIHAYLFGATCYAVYAVFCNLLAVVRLPVPNQVTILDALIDTNKTIDFLEVGVATLFSIPISLLYSAASNRKWLHRAAHVIGVSKKFGHHNVWGFTFDSPEVLWVVARDLKNNLMFDGWVRAFSDVESPRELLLFDVVVYNNTTGEELYKVDALYVSRADDDWTIEISKLAVVKEANAVDRVEPPPVQTEETKDGKQGP